MGHPAQNPAGVTVGGRAIQRDGGSPESPRAIRHDLLGVLDGLGREVSRPLISLRAGFDYALKPLPGPCSMTDSPRTSMSDIVEICDQLLLEARAMLESVAILDRAQPPQVGVFLLSGLAVALEREFDQVAHARRIQLVSEPRGKDISVSIDADLCLRALGGLMWDAFNLTPSGGIIAIVYVSDSDAWYFEVVSHGVSTKTMPCPTTRQAYGAGSDVVSASTLSGPGSVLARELVAPLGGVLHVVKSAEGRTHLMLRFGNRSSESFR